MASGRDISEKKSKLNNLLKQMDELFRQVDELYPPEKLLPIELLGSRLDAEVAQENAKEFLHKDDSSVTPEEIDTAIISLDTKLKNLQYKIRADDQALQNSLKKQAEDTAAALGTQTSQTLENIAKQEVSPAVESKKPLTIVALDFDGTLTKIPGHEMVFTPFYQGLRDKKFISDPPIRNEYATPLVENLESEINKPDPADPDNNKRVTTEAKNFLDRMLALPNDVQIVIISKNQEKYIKAMLEVAGLDKTVIDERVKIFDIHNGGNTKGRTLDSYITEKKQIYDVISVHAFDDSEDDAIRMKAAAIAQNIPSVVVHNDASGTFNWNQYGDDIEQSIELAKKPPVVEQVVEEEAASTDEIEEIADELQQNPLPQNLPLQQRLQNLLAPNETNGKTATVVLTDVQPIIDRLKAAGSGVSEDQPLYGALNNIQARLDELAAEDRDHPQGGENLSVANRKELFEVLYNATEQSQLQSLKQLLKQKPLDKNAVIPEIENQQKWLNEMEERVGITDHARQTSLQLKNVKAELSRPGAKEQHIDEAIKNFFPVLQPQQREQIAQLQLILESKIPAPANAALAFQIANININNLNHPLWLPLDTLARVLIAKPANDETINHAKRAALEAAKTTLNEQPLTRNQLFDMEKRLKTAQGMDRNIIASFLAAGGLKEQPENLRKSLEELLQQLNSNNPDLIAKAYENVKNEFANLNTVKNNVAIGFDRYIALMDNYYEKAIKRAANSQSGIAELPKLIDEYNVVIKQMQLYVDYEPEPATNSEKIKFAEREAKAISQLKKAEATLATYSGLTAPIEIAYHSKRREIFVKNGMTDEELDKRSMEKVAEFLGKTVNAAAPIKAGEASAHTDVPTKPKFNACVNCTSFGKTNLVSRQIEKNGAPISEFYFNLDKNFKPTRRKGLPDDRLLQWARSEVRNFVDNLSPGDKGLGMDIGGKLPKDYVEALMLVCANEKVLCYNKTGTPVNISGEQVKKVDERLKQIDISETTVKEEKETIMSRGDVEKQKEEVKNVAEQVLKNSSYTP